MLVKNCLKLLLQVPDHDWTSEHAFSDFTLTPLHSSHTSFNNPNRISLWGRVPWFVTNYYICVHHHVAKVKMTAGITRLMTILLVNRYVLLRLHLLLLPR